MGGYGSGRLKMSRLTTECIAIDTMQFKDYLRTPGTTTGHLVITSGAMKDHCPPDVIPGLAYCIERFERHTKWPFYDGKLTLDYVVKRGKQEQDVSISIPLITAPCNYGGVRWWMVAPCCGKRVRAVYIGSMLLSPMCRTCQGLHYESQRSSYIEKHITYEKYLLSNYGLQWEYNEYHSLKEHYFEITPEYEYKMRMSQLEQDLHLMRLLIDFETKMLKIHLRDMTSLKSDKDKVLYLEQVVKERGQDYALDLVKMLGLSIQFERAVLRSADTSILNDIAICYEPEYAAPISDEGSEPVPHTLKLLRGKEQAIKQEMQALEKEAA